MGSKRKSSAAADGTLSLPGDPDFVPSRGQTEAFSRAFRRALWPRIIHRELQERHLRLTNWDVAAAIRSFIREEVSLLPPQSRERNSLVGTIPPYPYDSAGPLQSVNDVISSLTSDSSSACKTDASAPASSVSIDDKYPPARMADLIRAMPRDPRNMEQERRSAAVQFRNSLVHNRRVKHREITVSMAILLLYLAEWDIGRALKEWETLDKALDRLHLEFDRMRSSEGTEVSNDVIINGSQERQSERLAILLSITTRPDWRSLQIFLAANRFNLISTIVKWYRDGIPVAAKKPDKKKVRKDVFKNPLPLPSQEDVVAPATDNQWADEPDFYRRVLGFSGVIDTIPHPPLREDDRWRAFGFLLHPDRQPLQAGRYHIEDYFVVESITKNKYVHSRFAKDEVKKKSDGMKFKWPKLAAGYAEDNKPEEDSADQGKLVIFDFSNTAHVGLLNNWRRQIYARTTGVMLRPGSQKWQPIELAMLYKLIEAYYEEYIINSSDPSEKEDWTLPVSQRMLQQWTDTINNAFVGTRPGNTAVRGERNWEAVGTQLRRTFPICEDFSIPQDNAWFKRKNASYRADQRKWVAHGKDQLPNWDPAAERKKTSALNVPVKGKRGKKVLPVEDDTATDPDDSDATKERKAHAKRSRAVLVRKNQARRQETEERRKKLVAAGAIPEDERDVLGGGAAFYASDEDEDEEDDGDDNGDDEREGSPAKKQRGSSSVAAAAAATVARVPAVRAAAVVDDATVPAPNPLRAEMWSNVARKPDDFTDVPGYWDPDETEDEEIEDDDE